MGDVLAEAIEGLRQHQARVRSAWTWEKDPANALFREREYHALRRAMTVLDSARRRLGLGGAELGGSEEFGMDLEAIKQGLAELEKQEGVNEEAKALLKEAGEKIGEGLELAGKAYKLLAGEEAPAAKRRPKNPGKGKRAANKGKKKAKKKGKGLAPVDRQCSDPACGWTGKVHPVKKFCPKCEKKSLVKLAATAGGGSA